MNVYPTLDLQTAYIFKDSKGNRLMLSPAEKMDDIGKVAQEFDGEDPLVAALLLREVGAKTIKVSGDAKKLLKATVKQAVDDAVTEDGKNGAAPAPAKAPSKAALDKTVKSALAAQQQEHDTAMQSALDNAAAEAQAAQDKAVQEALAEAGESPPKDAAPKKGSAKKG